MNSVERKHNPLRVLLIEDSEDDAALVLRELKRGGYDVNCRRVETAHDMRAMLSKETWDIVLSDYSLPEFDALRALDVLHGSGIDLPFIIVSGTIGEETAVAALHAGAQDFLVKGKLARLVPAVARGLSARAIREARRQSEIALRASETRYRRMVETMNEGMWLVDADAKTTFVNRRMTTMLGYEVEEMLGRSIFEFMHEESRAAVAKSIARPGEGLEQTEVHFKSKMQRDLWALVGATPIVDTEGRYEGALAMIMDVTHRKGLEEQLRQTQKMEAIGGLAGGVAHDFNNILSVILSYASLVLSDLKPNDPITADLEEIKAAAIRAGELTRQLLAFSRQQVLEPRTLDLNQIILGMEKMLRRLIGEDIELSLSTHPELGHVHADPGQIEQIVMNLVVNARDAMPQGGTITIETANIDLDLGGAQKHQVSPGAHVMMAVRDTGVGMDAATQARIFEPFFTTKERGKGTGLGLATVFGIVKQSAGQIGVYSGPGEGTTFKIFLPRTAGQVEPVPSAPQLTTLNGTETILLVEDEDPVRNMMRTVLSRRGYHVLDAQNGGEAFMLCEKYAAKIDLLVADVVMPRMNGRELAARLTPLRPGMRVLFVSGYAEGTSIQHGILDAGVHFLQKPVTPESLTRKVREVLDKPHGEAST